MERELGSLDLPVTFLRAAWFIENCQWDVASARAGSIASFLQPLERPVPMVACADISTLATELLQQTWQGTRVVELEGPQRISPADIAASFSRLLGREVSARAVPRDTWAQLFAAQGCTVDLRDESAIERFFNTCGAFDHLVYTAGDSLQLAPLPDTDLQTARSAFEIRYWGAMAAAKYGARNLRPGGSLTLTTGIAAQKPHANWTLVASVCGAVEALTRALAVELAPIRVNAVSPGVVATNLWSGMTEEACQRMYADLAAKLPVGRVGSAEDVAAAYLFLMTSGFATGQVHTVDGGGVLV